MILKSYIVEKNIHILDSYQSILLYGQNEGIKSDIRDKIKKANKEAEVINFFESEIFKDKNIIYKNIANESLFYEKKVIFIQEASDKIFNEIEAGLQENNPNIKICIFSDNLEKKSKLRSLFEKEKNLAIFACYEDNERTLINYINTELNEFKGLTGEIINLIITNSSLNRKIIQNEIIKIKHFFVEKIINKEHILEILNIKSNTNFDEIRDNALMGKRDKINRLLSEVNLVSEESFLYLNSFNYRIMKLVEIEKANKIFNDYEKTLDNFKPPVFWKDKPIYLQQLRKWNLNKLNKAANKIGETEIFIKKNSHIKSDLIIKNLIISILKEATVSA